ncbi:unnamed protein product [Phyllotreta striolata]|uniref:Peptidase M13 C-terminal domain-containing protein n=1 Tax=Phyllotreta striolata TaxID=444603 RepID=A0A9N9XRQ0_PHYSR|nr:unnamed protein product [Phyllotreta striolata]
MIAMFELKIILLLYFCCHCVAFQDFDENDNGLFEDNAGAGRVRRAIKSGKKDLSTVCSKSACKSATSQMLVSMNHHADACEEFQELVCGNKVQINGFTYENFQILENYIFANVTYKSEKFLQDFKKFYESCLHYNVDFNFLSNLDKVKSSTAKDLTDVFVESILTESMPFFDVSLDIGSSDENYQFLLSLPGESYLKTYLRGWSILDQSENHCTDFAQHSIGSKTVDLDELYDKYLKCKRDTLFKYAEDFEAVMKLTNKSTTNEAFLKEALELYQKNVLPSDYIRDTINSKKLTEMTIDEINSKYGLIDWKKFFGKITTNRTFTGNEKVLVAFSGYYQTLFDQFRKIDTGKLTKMLQDLTSLHLYRNFLTPRGASKRLYCMDLTQQLMPDIVSWILYDLSPASKIYLAIYQSKNIFTDLKKILKASFQDSSLDDMTKDKFIKKLDRLNLGLITEGDTNTTRDNYRHVKVRNDFQENTMTLLINSKKFLYNIVGSKSSPASILNFFVNGFYTKPVTFYTSDSIGMYVVVLELLQIPVEIPVLHPEIYKSVPTSLPEHVRLAKLGFSLAQGIAKHFDAVGRLFMTDGIRSSDNYYDELIKHMMEIFNNYYTKTPLSFHNSNLKFKPVSGKLFANEMIVDNAAFKLITEKFGKIKKQKDLPWINNGSITLNQTFFIAGAQEYCDDQSEATFMLDLLEKRRLPYQLKIRNIMSNSELFTKSFECLEGSALWLDPSIVRQFPQAPDDFEDGQSYGQYQN